MNPVKSPITTINQKIRSDVLCKRFLKAQINVTHPCPNFKPMILDRQTIYQFCQQFDEFAEFLTNFEHGFEYVELYKNNRLYRVKLFWEAA